MYSWAPITGDAPQTMDASRGGKASARPEYDPNDPVDVEDPTGAGMKLDLRDRGSDNAIVIADDLAEDVEDTGVVEIVPPYRPDH